MFGYDLGIVSGALLQLENKDGKLIDTFNLGTFEQELVVSLFLVGAIVASLTAGHLIDYVGRRIAIIANAVVFLIGAIGLSLAQDLTQLLVARVVVGYAVSFSAVAECVCECRRLPAYLPHTVAAPLNGNGNPRPWVSNSTAVSQPQAHPPPSHLCVMAANEQLRRHCPHPHPALTLRVRCVLEPHS